MTRIKKKIPSDTEVDGNLKTNSLTINDPALAERILTTDGSGNVTTDSSLDLDELHTLDGIDKTQTIQTQLDNLGTRITDLDDAAVHKAGEETIPGAKTFTADSTVFSKNVTVGTVNGNNTLTVTGAETVTGNISVGGTGTFGGGADITGTTDVDTLNSSAKATLNSLEVTNGSDLRGDTTVGGTLKADTIESHTAASPVTVNDDLTLSAGKTATIPILDVTTEIKNTTNGQAVKINDALNVVANITAGTGLTVSSGGADITGQTDVDTLISSGQATLNSLSVTNNATVAGATTLTGKLTANGGAEMNGTTDIKGATTIGTAQSNANLTVNGNGTVTGTLKVPIIDVTTEIKNTDSGEAVKVSDDLTVTGTLKVPTINVNTKIVNTDSNEPVLVDDDLTVTADKTLTVSNITGNGTDVPLEITTASKFDENITVASGKKVTAPTIEVSTVTGTSSGELDISTPVNVTGDLSATTDLSAGQNLAVAGNATVGGTLDVTGKTTTGTLESGAATFTGTITGQTVDASTFTGNSATATKLAATKNINGTAFDGSVDITTNKWGTARTIKIQDNDGTNVESNGVSVDGSANATLVLPATIKASLSGNATTATTLATPRNINDTAFDGSADITTAKWGTARTIKIQDNDGSNTETNGVSVDGSADATLKLPATIKATIDGNASTATKWQTKRTIGLSGVTATAQDIDGTADVMIPISAVPSSLLSGTIAADIIPAHASSETTYGVGNASNYGHVRFDELVNPNRASDSDKIAISETGIINFVNSSVEAVAAYYITDSHGLPWATKAALMATQASDLYSGGVQRTPTRNDYTIVSSDESHEIYDLYDGYVNFDTTSDYIGHYIKNSGTPVTYTLVTSSNKDSLSIVAGTTEAYERVVPSTRYIYNSDSATYSPNNWNFQYTFNQQYTQAQMSALNSGITATKVDKLDGLPQYAPSIPVASVGQAIGGDLKPVYVNSSGAMTPVANDLVTTAGVNQEIAGKKTFTYQAWFNNTVRLAPTSNIRRGIAFLKSNSTTEETVIGKNSDGSTVKFLTGEPTEAGLNDATIPSIGYINDYQKATYLVHTSGNETINGIKSFNDSIIATGNNVYGFQKMNSSLPSGRGSFVASGSYDTAIATLTNANSSQFFQLSEVDNTNAREIRFRMFTPTANNWRGLSITDNGSAIYATIPFRPYADGSTSAGASDVLTKAHLESAITIGGQKTFTSDPYVVRDTPNLILRDTTLLSTAGTKGRWEYQLNNGTNTNPSYVRASLWRTETTYTDANNRSTVMRLASYTRASDNTENPSNFKIVASMVSGSAVNYATAPYRSYASASNDDILTKAHLESDITINGVKTFSSTIQSTNTIVENNYVTGTNYKLNGDGTSSEKWMHLYRRYGSDDVMIDKDALAVSNHVTRRYFGIYAKNTSGTVVEKGVSIWNNSVDGYVTAPNRSYASASSSDVLVKGHVPDLISANVGNGQISLTSSRGTAIDNFTVNQSSGKNIVLPASSTQYQDQTLTFALQSTPDFSDYPYMASKSITGLTADMYATVTFSDAQVSSGQYAPFCQTLSGEIRLYAKSDVGAQTIPTISVGMDDSSAQQSMSNFVTLTGAQDISGAKTFTTNNVTIYKGTPTLNMKDAVDVSTTAPSSNRYYGFGFLDSAGTNHAGITFGHYTNGLKDLYFNIKGQDGTTNKLFHMYVDAIGGSYCSAPYRTYNSNNADDVVTIGMLKSAACTDVVHTTGNETISGMKMVKDGLLGNYVQTFIPDTKSNRWLGVQFKGVTTQFLKFYVADYINNSSSRLIEVVMFWNGNKTDSRVYAKIFGPAYTTPSNSLKVTIDTENNFTFWIFCQAYHSILRNVEIGRSWTNNIEPTFVQMDSPDWTTFDTVKDVIIQ